MIGRRCFFSLCCSWIWWITTVQHLHLQKQSRKPIGWIRSFASETTAWDGGNSCCCCCCCCCCCRFSALLRGAHILVHVVMYLKQLFYFRQSSFLLHTTPNEISTIYPSPTFWNLHTQFFSPPLIHYDPSYQNWIIPKKVRHQQRTLWFIYFVNETYLVYVDFVFMQRE